MTTCLILWIPGTTATDGPVAALVDGAVDGLVRDGPLDEQPIVATATTTATIPTYRVEGQGIRGTLRAASGSAARGRPGDPTIVGGL
ncbi:MAG TPA: hypothetical protein VIK54_19485 [Acidimicrobiia bacterium]